MCCVCVCVCVCVFPSYERSDFLIPLAIPGVNPWKHWYPEHMASIWQACAMMYVA